MAEETQVPLDVLLAFALGLVLGVLAMVLWSQAQPPTVLGPVAGVPRLVVQRDEFGRITSIG